MSTFLIAFVVMLLLVAGMAVGIIMGRSPIAGSCGGLNRLGMKDGCEICGGKDEVCEEENRKRKAAERRASDISRGADLGYDASRR
ncbi:MAG TPA: (Na+)-NQR maturation NqrM [Candidatus Halomonas stercoripullorum]|uniref:(Na+)-NQR maturation NqrM n=1 Tax=Candidatus Halomonas stercoripullorum TaxID=2838617 RepID=A0A9D2B5M2_9GAMM|nr:(Na+)-NQR maturation NqrM [Candidatus Halomonas stercoripullorum]